MKYTRVPNRSLTAALARAITALGEAEGAVADLLVLLTSEERSSLPRPRDGFLAVARNAAHNGDLAELGRAVGYDAEAVLEDVANVEAIDRVRAPLAKLQQRLDDSRLLWLAEAYSMTLELYGVARARAKSDASVAAAIEDLVTHLASPRLKKG